MHCHPVSPCKSIFHESMEMMYTISRTEQRQRCQYRWGQRAFIKAMKPPEIPLICVNSIAPGLAYTTWRAVRWTFLW